MDYVCYICRECNNEFVLLAEQLKNKTRPICCPYCRKSHVEVEDRADTVRDCMKERSYTRVSGALKQVRYEVTL